MICEICGKEIKKGYKIYVEGTVLTVCEECRRFGKEIDGNDVKKDIKIKKNINLVDYSVENDLGKILRGYREKNNLKQEDMAKLLGIKESLYRSIEEGKIVPPIDVVKKIEKILGIKLIKKETFFENKNNKEVRLTVADIIEFDDKG